LREHQIIKILKKRESGKKCGIYSACTANRYVIEAVLEKALEAGTAALIEATANQVNQFGGYTGMKPVDFAGFVLVIVEKTGFPAENLILGGDHLGPLCWQNEPEKTAMEKAGDLIREYVLAGYSKIHIDTSMKLADDPSDIRLSDDIIAGRAAQLAKAAESAFAEIQTAAERTGTEDLICAPVYVIGSEVPVPGGAQDNNELISLTKAEEFEHTYESFKNEFHKNGLHEAFNRVIAVVVQPGVEFSDASVSEYDRQKAEKLCKSLEAYPDLVFEGHSTDYQTRNCLRQMVEDGIAILKVGPALTFALRQALFALNDIETELFRGKADGQGKSGQNQTQLSYFRKTLDDVMLKNPVYWEKYYQGVDNNDIAIKRKYSFSDRCRYYLPVKEVDDSINRLITNLNIDPIPLSVLEQYLPIQYSHVRDGKLDLDANAILKDRVKDYIADYLFATGER